MKKAHLRRPTFGGYPRARALAAAYAEYASLGPGYPSQMGDAALHLDLFERPGEKRDSGNPSN